MARRGYRQGFWDDMPRSNYRGSMVVQRFDTVGEYLDFVKTDVENFRGERSSHKRDTWGDWYGGASWEQALYLAEHGWPEGVEKVEKFTNKLNTVLSGWIKQPEIRYENEGLAIDIGKYQSGEPEFMMQIVDSAIRLNARPPRIVKIVMNTCVSGSNGADVLILRGAAVAALVTMLERHGTRCEVDLNASNRAGPGIETWVRIKNADQPMNLPYLVFLLAHASSFRRLMFSAWEHLSPEIRSAVGIYEGGGYGYVGEVKDAKNRGDIYISGTESEVGLSERQTLEWIKAELEKQGIEVEHD